MSEENDIERKQRIEDMLIQMARHTMRVFEFGTEKHPESGDEPNFLMKNGNKCSLRERGSSVLRHAARTFMHPEAVDEESGLPELLHLIASATIIYTRQLRNIVHEEDEHAIKTT